MWRVYFAVLGRDAIAMQVVGVLFKVATMMAGPWFLFALLQGLEGTTEATEGQLWFYAGGILIAPMSFTLVQSLHTRLVTRYACDTHASTSNCSPHLL